MRRRRQLQQVRKSTWEAGCPGDSMEAWVHSGALYRAAGPAMGTGRQGGGTWMDVSQVTQVSAQKPRKGVAVSPCLLGQAPARRWGQMSARSAASSRALRWWEAAAQKEASWAEDREAGVALLQVQTVRPAGPETTGQHSRLLERCSPGTWSRESPSRFSEQSPILPVQPQSW